MKKERNFGIDLLRIVFMLLICTLHVIKHGGVLGNVNSTLQNCLCWAMLSVCMCSVNGYTIISGYCASKNEGGGILNYQRIIKLWFEACFYSILTNIIFLIVENGHITFEVVKHMFMPVSYGNWYFSSYFLVFFIAIFIKSFIINELSEKAAKKLLFVFIVLFSIIPFFVKDNYYLNNGFSSMWILIVYCIGVLAKKSNIFNKYKISTLLLLFLALCFISFLMTIYTNYSVTYVSPLCLLSSIVLVVAFSKMNFDGIWQKTISTISPLTFGVYLFHDNEHIRELFINDRFLFINQYNIIGVGLAILVSAIAIFIISAVIDLLRKKLFDIFKIDKLTSWAKLD